MSLPEQLSTPNPHRTPEVSLPPLVSCSATPTERPSVRRRVIKGQRRSDMVLMASQLLRSRMKQLSFHSATLSSAEGSKNASQSLLPGNLLISQPTGNDTLISNTPTNHTTTSIIRTNSSLISSDSEHKTSLIMIKEKNDEISALQSKLSAMESELRRHSSLETELFETQSRCERYRNMIDTLTEQRTNSEEALIQARQSHSDMKHELLQCTQNLKMTEDSLIKYCKLTKFNRKKRRECERRESLLKQRLIDLFKSGNENESENANMINDDDDKSGVHYPPKNHAFTRDELFTVLFEPEKLMKESEESSSSLGSSAVVIITDESGKEVNNHRPRQYRALNLQNSCRYCGAGVLKSMDDARLRICENCEDRLGDDGSGGEETAAELADCRLNRDVRADAEDEVEMEEMYRLLQERQKAKAKEEKMESMSCKERSQYNRRRSNRMTNAKLKDEIKLLKKRVNSMKSENNELRDALQQSFAAVYQQKESSSSELSKMMEDQSKKNDMANDDDDDSGGLKKKKQLDSMVITSEQVRKAATMMIPMVNGFGGQTRVDHLMAIIEDLERQKSNLKKKLNVALNRGNEEDQQIMDDEKDGKEREEERGSSSLSQLRVKITELIQEQKKRDEMIECYQKRCENLHCQLQRATEVVNADKSKVEAIEQECNERLSAMSQSLSQSVSEQIDMRVKLVKLSEINEKLEKNKEQKKENQKCTRTLDMKLKQIQKEFDHLEKRHFDLLFKTRFGKYRLSDEEQLELDKLIAKAKVQRKERMKELEKQMQVDKDPLLALEKDDKCLKNQPTKCDLDEDFIAGLDQELDDILDEDVDVDDPNGNEDGTTNVECDPLITPSMNDRTTPMKSNYSPSMSVVSNFTVTSIARIPSDSSGFSLDTTLELPPSVLYQQTSTPLKTINAVIPSLSPWLPMKDRQLSSVLQTKAASETPLPDYADLSGMNKKNNNDTNAMNEDDIIITNNEELKEENDAMKHDDEDEDSNDLMDEIDDDVSLCNEELILKYERITLDIPALKYARIVKPQSQSVTNKTHQTTTMIIKENVSSMLMKPVESDTLSPPSFDHSLVESEHSRSSMKEPFSHCTIRYPRISTEIPLLPTTSSLLCSSSSSSSSCEITKRQNTPVKRKIDEIKMNNNNIDKHHHSGTVGFTMCEVKSEMHNKKDDHLTIPDDSFISGKLSKMILICKEWAQYQRRCGMSVKMSIEDGCLDQRISVQKDSLLEWSSVNEKRAFRLVRHHLWPTIKAEVSSMDDDRTMNDPSPFFTLCFGMTIYILKVFSEKESPPNWAVCWLRIMNKTAKQLQSDYHHLSDCFQCKHIPLFTIAPLIQIADQRSSLLV